jgi:hypothetical protein
VLLILILNFYDKSAALRVILVLTLLQAVLELIRSSVVQREIQSLTSNQVLIEEAGTVY